MVKLPILQKLLKRDKPEEELVIIRNCCYSFTNFILLVRKSEEGNENFINEISHRFINGMESDFELPDVLKSIKEVGIISKQFYAERAMFILFERD